MKVLFLDMDGVMNSADWWRSGDRPRSGVRCIDPATVPILQDIIMRTGCRVVISSAWRIGNSLEKIVMSLMASGLQPEAAHEFIGVTPREGGRRLDEIEKWIHESSDDVEEWAVLDDNGLGADCSRLVQTDFEHGLRWEHAVSVIKLLGET